MKEIKIGDTLRHKRSGNEWTIKLVTSERIYADNATSNVCPRITNKEYKIINK